MVESLEYVRYQHGFDEASGRSLTPYASYLLGLGFREHCRASAESAGADVTTVHAFVRHELEIIDGSTASELEGKHPIVRALREAGERMLGPSSKRVGGH